MKDSSSVWRLWDLTAPDLMETSRRSYPTTQDLGAHRFFVVEVGTKGSAMDNVPAWNISVRCIVKVVRGMNLLSESMPS